MNLKLKKKVWCMSTLVLVVCMTCIVYSCNSEDAFFDETGICEGEVHTHALSARSICTLVDSVADSNEFLDYILQFRLVKSKFTLYLNSLDNDELETFNYNINNDEFIDDFIVKAELSEDMQLLIEYRDELLSSMSFCKLKDIEKKELFNYSSSSNIRSLTKDREEILYSVCWEPYQRATSFAENECALKILGCLCTGGFTCPCVIAAYKEMDDAIAKAKSEFEDCQRRHNAKH
ncbi:hypothetical protein BOVA604_4079 [Bacteroides ovatus]|jgi:hypothetical protein bacD2_10752|uniref:hypothetical protein n=2 Tax=Bacteroides TaxID=816 RepID=UPI000E8BF637|nr:MULTISPECIES: hypothetical protein [Bacteroides]MCS3176098.1 hypothetical protein [Candidatus Bacteroides intestinigallinarum]RGN53109.1 hypothetical protein DXB58_26155 [Bacteroides sp. OM05-10AA]RGQ56849.1 hypothetical protein DWY87_26430 [Bacteroides sp. AF27-33]CAG9900314.1 hypothetical protein BOVA604_4079 [Bacteroides ovatus]